MIAKEKAGIIKNNTLCISAPQNSLVEKVLVNKCALNNSKLIICYENSFFNEINDGFIIKGLKNNTYTFSTPSLNGRHQIINAVLAATSLILFPKLKVSYNHINEGITSTMWKGRLELINKGNIKKIIPTSSEVWLDGGHNIAGAKIIKQWINDEKMNNIILICGFLKNKDVKKILSILKAHINYIIFVPLENTKNSYSIKELKMIAKSINIKNFYKNSLKDALDSELILPESKILIFGSLYLVGEVIKIDNI